MHTYTCMYIYNIYIHTCIHIYVHTSRLAVQRPFVKLNYIYIYVHAYNLHTSRLTVPRPVVKLNYINIYVHTYISTYKQTHCPKAYCKAELYIHICTCIHIYIQADSLSKGLL